MIGMYGSRIHMSHFLIMDAYDDLVLVLKNQADLIALSEKYKVFRFVNDFNLKTRVCDAILDHLMPFLFCVTADFALTSLAYNAYYSLTRQQSFFTAGKPLISLLIGNPGNFSLRVRSRSMFIELKKIKFDEDIYTPNWMYCSLYETYFTCKTCNKIFIYWCRRMRALDSKTSCPRLTIDSYCAPGDVTHWRPNFTSHIE